LNVGECDKCGDVSHLYYICDGQKTADSNYPDVRHHTRSRGLLNVEP